MACSSKPLGFHPDERMVSKINRLRERVREMEMELKDDVGLIQLAIQQLMEEEESASDHSSFIADHNGDQQLLLSKLLSQLETLRDSKLQQPDPSADIKELSSPAAGRVESKSEIVKDVDSSSIEIGRNEIIEELRKVRKQNFITHCLLSVMVVVTVAWQLSEVSLILKFKNGLSHPFRSFGGFLTGILNGPHKNGQNGEKHDSNQHQTEAHLLPHLKMPDLPHMDFPSLDLNSCEE